MHIRYADLQRFRIRLTEIHGTGTSVCAGIQQLSIGQ